MIDEEASSIDVGTDTDPEPASASDAEVTKAHNTTFPQSAGLDIEANDIGYLATVQLGTPPRDFHLLADSGSADIWVGGENCQADEGGGCGDHKFLGEKSSSSFRDTGKPWGIGYGIGHVSGNMVVDHVTFARFTLQNHTFGVASNESAQFTPDNIPLDGIVGCAKLPLSIQQTPTLVEALRSTGLIASNIISYKISRESDGKNDGEITMGAMDPSKFVASSLVRVKNVNTGGFWEANLDAITVNGEDVGLVNRSCIWDTGTDVDAIHSVIPGAKFDTSSNTWTVPCDTDASVSLVFGGKSSQYSRAIWRPPPVDHNNTTGACTSAIAEGGVSKGPTHWLVGGMVLKNVHLSTNEDTEDISIARLAN
ncbi:aspartic peptidase domain-containing protein [Mycena rosella]|uniref:Aspartic peptidase domain-containing protein n=1 Tax=Mycena rosella TaxID=1033263 RepID=A0AAD7D4J7_MYCRO|nr:aspartic peptidase domain-containing protein [Mycena rosella]